MHLDSLTILLVEDDAGYAGLVERMFAAMAPRHRIETVHTLAAAMARLAESRVDAVLLDPGLPDSTGVDTIRDLTRYAPSVPVVVLTASSDDALESDALLAGAEDFARKDQVAGEDLLRLVRHAIDRKWAVHAVRHKHGTLESLFNTSPLPIVVVDTARVVRMWNPAAERVFGWTAAEVVGRVIENSIPLNDGDADYVAEVLAGASISAREMRARRRDGRVIDVSVSASPLLDDARRVVGITAIYKDVTGQAQVDARLRFVNEASALLNSADLDGSLTAVAALAAHTVADGAAILLVDERQQLTQYYLGHRDDTIRETMSERADRRRRGELLLPPALIEALQARQSHLAASIPDDRQAYYFGEDRGALEGRFSSVIIVPLSTGGRPFGLIVLGARAGSRRYDDADLTTAEDLGRRLALTIENARLVRQARDLFEGDITGNFIAAEDGRIIASNPAFREIVGLADDRQTNVGMTELFEAGAWRDLVRMVRREGRVGTLEMELRGAHGNALNVLLSAMGMFDERGVMTGLRGQLYDISAHKRVELQFSQSQKMEAIGRLAGGIAHDFNNLLTIIGGQAERLIEGLKPGDPLRRSADAVAQAAERASGLTQQLLAFSRRQVMAPRLISINDLVKNVHGMLERVIGEDINCEVSLSTAVGAVKVDPSRLEQALLNLAVNARDAMPTGGTLSIATANAVLDEAYGRDHLGAKPGHYVCLSVSDNGCGMDPATRARVFEPFFTTKEVGKGTGLGLSMVYGIVKQSGGYIWVYSEAGVGTSFKIYLPVADTIDAAAVQHDVAPAEVKASPARGSETVLLVEDEEDLRELLEEVLSQQGYRVYAASGGTSALQISEFMDEDIDLMITDVVMPQMSGRELSLKLQSRRPNVRILFLSGYTDDAISHHGVLEPGSAFLQKPFATAELARKVREVLESPSTN